MPKIYFQPGFFPAGIGPKKTGFILSGEKRAPKAGEWYLSGAIPEAYRAPADLSDVFYILRPVPVRLVPAHWELEAGRV